MNCFVRNNFIQIHAYLHFFFFLLRVMILIEKKRFCQMIYILSMSRNVLQFCEQLKTYFWFWQSQALPHIAREPNIKNLRHHILFSRLRCNICLQSLSRAFKRCRLCNCCVMWVKQNINKYCILIIFGPQEQGIHYFAYRYIVECTMFYVLNHTCCVLKREWIHNFDTVSETIISLSDKKYRTCSYLPSF